MVGGEVGPRVHRKRSKPWTLKGVGDLGKKCPQWKEIGKGCKDRAMRDPAEEGRDITNKRPLPLSGPQFPCEHRRRWAMQRFQGSCECGGWALAG